MPPWQQLHGSTGRPANESASNSNATTNLLIDSTNTNCNGNEKTSQRSTTSSSSSSQIRTKWKGKRKSNCVFLSQREFSSFTDRNPCAFLSFSKSLFFWENFIDPEKRKCFFLFLRDKIFSTERKQRFVTRRKVEVFFLKNVFLSFVLLWIFASSSSFFSLLFFSLDTFHDVQNYKRATFSRFFFFSFQSVLSTFVLFVCLFVVTDEIP